MAQEQMSPSIVLATEESPAEEILLMEGPPRTTEEVVQDVLTTTAGASKGMSQDVEVQTKRASQEDQTEEVVLEITEAQDEDHTLNTSADPTRRIFSLVQLDQPENEIPLERSPPRAEKKGLQALMTSTKRCWRVNVDVMEIRTFTEEKEKECLLAKAEQENAESAFQTLKLKLSEVEKRSEENAVVIIEKTEENRLLAQKNEKLQEILSRQSKESHDLFEQNKMLMKEKEELKKAKEDLQKISFNKDLQIQDLKEVEKRSRSTVQELEKKVETLMKAGKEITTVTGNSFSQILASHKDIAELNLPKTTRISFPNGKDDLMNFEATIRPDEGYYVGGKFVFTFQVPPAYPHEPPKVKCKTKVYHPNIDLEGNVCLNILREDWKPVLNINSVVYGLNLLFSQPNDEDPLNHDAAAVLRDNPLKFEENVQRAMAGGYVGEIHFPRCM